MAGSEAIAALRAGGKLALARALTRIETGHGQAEVDAFLDAACREGSGHVLGLTGPPGAGKSTLTNSLLKALRGAGKTTGVIAVDPSSRRSGGALLGDRTRLTADPEDAGIFIRSMAARDRLGGLSDHALAAIAVMRAAREAVIVESVGIGQSEADVAIAVDTLVLCIQPGSGDSLQFMKAGVMELPDIIVVTKADMGAYAARAVADVKGALSLSDREREGWQVPVLPVSAQDGSGLEALHEAIEAHRVFLEAGGLAARRFAQRQEAWVADYLKTRYGQAGSHLLDPAALIGVAGGPFTAMRLADRRLVVKVVPDEAATET
ncbi:ArgK protein [Pannonibacter phragmitetus]|uniref:ArgK/MeaB family GTPase n=1 Tax=Pannonibacter phragmitetus TaxID=121719 RepID=UPI00067D6EB4|nr:ArgK protein [Pannonibacter phragmitetus]KND19309.1 ArgK protein [Pannonibacter phragmitetus]